MAYCGQCGTAIPEGAAFCPNCGGAVRPRAETPPPHTPAFAGPAPAAARPAYPPVGGYPAPGAGVPAAGGRTRSVFRWLIALFALALVFLFFIRPRLPQWIGLGGVPTFSSVREVVKPQVGRFTLRETRPKSESEIEGATDSAVMTYRSADGVEVEHGLAVFPSAAQAEAQLDELRREAGRGLGRIVREEPSRNRWGRRVGTRIVYSIREATADTPGLEGVLWTNGNLLCGVHGPTGAATEFHRSLRY